jgi:hypothetical protein
MIKFIVGGILLFFLPSVRLNAYTNLGKGVYQSDGTVRDTQAAINAAPTGSTVQIPNGSYTWTAAVTIPGKAIRLTAQSPGGATITNNSSVDGIILVTEAKTQSIEVSALRIVSGSPTGIQGTHHHLRVFHSPGGKPVLLHDCYFETNGGALVYGVEWLTNSGVIWNCQFASSYNFAGGIQFKTGNNASWTTPSTMGMADKNGTANAYVEDCTFTGMYLGCVDFDDDSRVVIRHCTMDNSAIYCHGQDTSADGARHWEVYDNTFIYTASGSPPGFPKVTFPLNLQDWLTIRGGTGIIADNVFPNILYKNCAIQMNVYSINRSSHSIPCQTQYPAARQVGQTWIGAGGYSYPRAPTDGTGYSTDPIYIWGNTGTATLSPTFVGLNQYSPDECGNGQLIADYVRAGRDYIVGTPKPGYAKYSYPHPLRNSLSDQPKSRPDRMSGKKANSQ